MNSHRDKKEKLSERAIRGELLRSLRSCPQSVIIEEVKIEGGAARIDMVAFGDDIVGYEIKSDFDNFDRMTNQIHAYNRVFPKIHLVCGDRHLDYALAVLPSWWGVIQATLVNGGDLTLHQIRDAQHHDKQDPFSVASLLSKRDAVELLKSHGFSMRPSSNLRALWAAIADSVPLVKIESAIVKSLKSTGPCTGGPLFDAPTVS